MEFLPVFVHDETDKEIPARLLLLLRRKVAEGFRKDFVGGTIGYLMDEIALGFCDGPRVADRRATLRNNTRDRDVTPNLDGNSAFGKHLALEIDLRGLF